MIRKHYIYYLIDPRINEVFYVGTTINPKNRHKQHIYYNKNSNNKKENYIQEILNDGYEPQMKIIDQTWEYYDMEERLLSYEILERKYIQEGYEKGYNLKNIELYGNAMNPEQEVYQYDDKGYFIKRFHSHKEASIYTGLYRRSISRAVDQKERNSYAGYYWFSSHEVASKFKFEKIKKREYLNYKKILQYDKNGNLVKTYNKIDDASNMTGINIKSIYKSLNQKDRKTGGGYYWFSSDIKAKIFVNKIKNTKKWQKNRNEINI